MIELPKGVFITTISRSRGGGNVDIVDADACAAHHFQLGRALEQFGGDFGRGAYRQPVVIGDDLGEFVLFEFRFDVDLNSFLLEDSDGGGESLSEMRTRGAIGKPRSLPKNCERCSVLEARGNQGEERAALPGLASASAIKPLWPTCPSQERRRSPAKCRASMSAVSTVAPHQMRSPGGASR